MNVLEFALLINATRSYSGRGMYGATCVGVVARSLSEVMQAVVEAAMNIDEDDRNDFRKFTSEIRTDNMGMDVIVYFPRAACTDEDAAEFDEAYQD